MPFRSTSVCGTILETSEDLSTQMESLFGPLFSSFLRVVRATQPACLTMPLPSPRRKNRKRSFSQMMAEEPSDPLESLDDFIDEKASQRHTFATSSSMNAHTCSKLEESLLQAASTMLQDRSIVHISELARAMQGLNLSTQWETSTAQQTCGSLNGAQSSLGHSNYPIYLIRADSIAAQLAAIPAGVAPEPPTNTASTTPELYNKGPQRKIKTLDHKRRRTNAECKSGGR
mmetsp:Transcript_2945/g.11249  ORF Transcript_2945/g.11249 Transcript_2945/m.11249 type:complete len:230 (-) Transcript_2945:80-769(-)